MGGREREEREGEGGKGGRGRKGRERRTLEDIMGQHRDYICHH